VKASAAVRFAAKVAERRGNVSDEDIAAVKAAGYSEAQIVEIVGLVAENVLTNFLNNVAKTDIDFPVVHTAKAA
jgi:alkylhydroperoxidase family enzyme